MISRTNFIGENTMHLWLPSILPDLPGRLLCSLHRDCCRIRAGKWKSYRGPGSWFYSLPWGAITWYHAKVLREMESRGWKPDGRWFDPLYRGKSQESANSMFEMEEVSGKSWGAMFRRACPYTPDSEKSLLDAWRDSHK